MARQAYQASLPGHARAVVDRGQTIAYSDNGLFVNADGSGPRDVTRNGAWSRRLVARRQRIAFAMPRRQRCDFTS